MNLRDFLKSFLDLIFPRYCAICGEALDAGEESICLKCYATLPRVGYHAFCNTELERRFEGKFPLAKAAAFMYYRKNDAPRQMILLMKYKNRPDVAVTAGKLMALELSHERFFDGIDLLIPVPLHKKRLKWRGYNQSEMMARGISEITGIPVDATAVERIKKTPAQARQVSWLERWKNVEGVFRVAQPDKYRHKHILLIDDVITSTATTSACSSVFKDIEGISISVLGLARAGARRKE